MGTSSQSSGTTSYEYDAVGNIIKKQTPAMREALPSGEYLSYDYDSLGRVLAAWHQHPGGTLPKRCFMASPMTAQRRSPESRYRPTARLTRSDG